MTKRLKTIRPSRLRYAKTSAKTTVWKDTISLL